MEIISIINQKGGVGKSTTAYAIGTGLQLRGFKVLFIDLDPQGNLSYTLDVETNTKNIMNVLVNPNLIFENIHSVNNVIESDLIKTNEMRTDIDNLRTLNTIQELEEVPQFVEVKSKRFQLLMKPSIYENMVKKISYPFGILYTCNRYLIYLYLQCIYFLIQCI